MSNLITIDGCPEVLSDEERESRLLAIRQEGTQLLNFYQSIKDTDVRAAILVLVKSMMTRDKLASGLEREVEADTHRAD